VCCSLLEPDADVDQLFDTYSSVLRDIAHQLAPSHVIRRCPGRPTPWFDSKCRAERRHCRRLERRYRRTCRQDDRRSPENLLRKVQSVQNVSARLLTSARRCDHITPLLRQLHWLPVQRRVEFKIACLVHQSLASLAPTYLTTDIYLVSEYGRRSLRSSTDRTLTVPRSHNRFGDRSFAVAGPRLWNSLPISLRQIFSFEQFRRYLRNYLFGI